jgi:hypothetical protein
MRRPPSPLTRLRRDKSSQDMRRRDRGTPAARALHERSASPITNGLPGDVAEGEPFEKEIRLGWKELLARL